MAFSSVRENVTPNTQLELCWKMLLFIIFCINSILNLFYSFISSIDFPFIFIFISLVLCLIPFYQQMLLLYILFNRCYCCLFYWLLMINQLLFIQFCFIMTNRCYCCLFCWFLMEYHLLFVFFNFYLLF